MGAITKRQVAALTLTYAIIRGIVEKVKPETPADESNIDNVVFNATMAASQKQCPAPAGN